MNARNHLKRVSVSPAIREMQVQVTRRSLYKPARVTKIKILMISSSVGEDTEQLCSLTTFYGSETISELKVIL